MAVYIGSLPEILEQRPPRAARDDENGLTASRRFSVLSTSRVAAILRLREVGIARGRPYQEPNGGIPDPFCLCQSVEAIGKPDALAQGQFGGGLGQYICDADYARKQTSPGAQPGGPVRWSRRASLVSTPVDIDGEGKKILTSSLESPDPPLTALLPEEVLHGEFYWQASDELAAAAVFRPFEGKVNQSPHAKLAAPRGSLLCYPFTTQPGDTGWILMTVDIQYRAPKVIQGKTYEGWMDVFPDRGRRAVQDASQVDPSRRFAWVKDPNGLAIPDPLLLDGQGGILSAFTSTSADYLESIRSGTVNKSVMNYKYAEFSNIPFPT